MSAVAVGYVDTTLRDLVAYPWSSTISTEEVAEVARGLARSGAVVIEALDSFSFRGAIEGRGESPWDRLRVIVDAAGSVPVGIVVASRTLFGSQPVSGDLMRRLVAVAVQSGATRVRIVDPLNDIDGLREIAAAVVDAGAEFIPTLVLGPSPAVADERWIDEAQAMAQLPGATAICVVDRAGHVRPADMHGLVPKVRDAANLPVELSIVGPGALAPVSSVAGVEAGAARVQAAVGAAALAAARPSVETLRAALADGDHALACDRERINELAEMIWALVPPDRLRQAQAAESGPVLGLPLDLAAGLTSRLTRLGRMDQLVSAVDEVVQVAADAGNLTLTHPLGPAVVAQAIRHVAGDERWSAIEPTLAEAIRGDFGTLRGEVAPAAAAAAAAAEIDPPADTVDMAAARSQAPDGLSEEDVLLWTMFPEGTERLIARRKSLVGEAADSMASLDRGLIETLVDVVEKSGQAEISVEVGGARVTVRRTGAAPLAAAPVAAGSPVAVSSGESGAPSAGARVESPIVGTFYSAPSPEAPPFVKVGDKVAVGQTLCIIEAMKIFNEITAEHAGTVTSVAVQNAEPVEYGTLLFTIEP